MYWRLVKSRIDFEIASMRQWISLQGPDHLRGLSGINPDHLQLLCWPFTNEEEGTQRVAVWLLRICELWAGISILVPTSEVPCILELFWGMCVCFLPSCILRPAHTTPQINNSNWKRWAGFLKSTRKDSKFLLVPHPILARGTLSHVPPSFELCPANQVWLGIDRGLDAD